MWLRNPITSMKHKTVYPIGHKKPFYNIKEKKKKKNFPIVSKLALGYLISGSTKISFNSLMPQVFQILK